MEPFLPALAGGALIGAAAVLLYATVGRIAGISGIAFGAVLPAMTGRRWRYAFLAGLIAGGWLATLALGPLPSPAAATAPAAMLAVFAGLLVGAGTHVGSGCTSGHGVCGLARLSRRSLASVVVFMAFGMVAATLLRPVLS